MAGLKYSTDGSTWKTLKNYTIKNVDVLQSTGESTEGVMSQKAVTDALAAKADTSALGEYVKETDLTEKVTEVVKTETVKENSDLTDAIGDMVAKAIQDALKEGASESDIKEAIDKAVADAIGDEDGEVKSAIEAAVSGKADKDDLNNLFDGAVYTTGTMTGTQGKQVIAFKHGETVVAEVDATDFIKDGMVSNVEVNDGNLEITFNEDGGNKTIKVAISDIFNASNYYTKSEVNTELAKKANSATTLSGYGITDAKIDGGVITLGNETITPITSLNGYATEEFVTSKGYTTNAGTVTSVGVSVPTGLSVSSSPVTSSGTIAITLASGYEIPQTSTLLKGSITTASANSNITNFSETTASGTQLHIIYTNTSSNDTTVTIPTEGYKTPDGQQMNITVPKGGYAEVNLMNIGGTIYVRGI